MSYDKKMDLVHITDYLHNLKNVKTVMKNKHGISLYEILFTCDYTPTNIRVCVARDYISIYQVNERGVQQTRFAEIHVDDLGNVEITNMDLDTRGYPVLELQDWQKEQLGLHDEMRRLDTAGRVVQIFQTHLTRRRMEKQLMVYYTNAARDHYSQWLKRK